jgi:outer membrane protein TolC
LLRGALVQEAEVRVRQEKARPFLPLFVLSGFQSSGGMLIQAGLFGLGPNSSLNQWTGRVDLSVQLAWQLENFGMGNLARIKRQRGQESQAFVDLRNAQDQVAEEVNQAQARAQAAAVRIVQADRALRTGIITLIAEYNRSQFELVHALDYPAYEISQRRPPGDIQPVDTARPPFLASVGNGPPPATR